jgi:hypothetical protein
MAEVVINEPSVCIYCRGNKRYFMVNSDELAYLIRTFNNIWYCQKAKEYQTIDTSGDIHYFIFDYKYNKIHK